MRKDLGDISHEEESVITFVMHVQQLLIGAVRGVAAAYVSDLELRIQVLLPALAVWPQVLVRQAGACLAAPSCCGCILWYLCGALRAPLCISPRPGHVCQLVPFCSRLHHFTTRYVFMYPTAHSLGYLTAGVTSSGLHCCKLMGLLAAGNRQFICEVPTPTGERHA